MRTSRVTGSVLVLPASKDLVIKPLHVLTSMSARKTPVVVMAFQNVTTKSVDSAVNAFTGIR